MKVGVNQILHCSPYSEIEIPGVSSWSEIKDWFVKWGTLYYMTENDEDWKSVDLNQNNLLDSIDAKNPDTVFIFDENQAILAEKQF